MFFVSLLLNQTLGWMRTRSGTDSLRAILYIDELFGFMPPVAEPPSKKPLLTLLKQARAFGVECVLATQNPVDLDYKGLSNAGTWFVGRLQTDRDRARVLDGLQGATSGKGSALDRSALESALAGLGKRVFLLHNVHEEAPAFFHTRWAMSYLRGPLTREQIRTLMAGRQGEGHREAVSAPAAESPGGGQAVGDAAPTETGVPPVLPPGVPQVFLPPRLPRPDAGTLVYRPSLLGQATVHYSDARRGVEHSEEVCLLTSVPPDGSPDWSGAEDLELSESAMHAAPAEPAAFEDLPPAAALPGSYRGWERDLTDFLFRNRRLVLLRSPATGEASVPGESERDFRVRLGHRFHELRDEEAAKLRAKYDTKVASLEERIRRAEQTAARHQERVKQERFQTAVSMGATFLDAFLGRKRVTRSTMGRATTTLRGVGRAGQKVQEAARAQENVTTLEARLQDLEAEFQAEVEALDARLRAGLETFQETSLKPLKRDIQVRRVALAWTPGWTHHGAWTPAHRKGSPAPGG